MKPQPRTIAFALLYALFLSLSGAAQDWTHRVRIGAYGLRPGQVNAIVQDATESHVFGIEVDNDITGRYESFLDPGERLKVIRAAAERAHASGNYAFVYIAGLECITAHAAASPHSMFKDHPDWVQRNLQGDPAVFGGGQAFWIAPGDEDVWISPFAPEWRRIYMERVRQIAATGIDGIYVDIPYWMTHFEGWEQSWASFDDYTVAAFKQQFGLDARHDLRLGDYTDPGFIDWINFRMNAITDFMKEIDQNVKRVNSKCKTIAEIYAGIEESVPRIGADVYALYPVVDAIGHEYEYGDGEQTAASRSPLDWFSHMVGMYSFRSFAEGKPTWILNYSWDGAKRVTPREAMENLFVSELMAGANVWDARGHVMSGSNDWETRRQVFAWIAAHEATFYGPRLPLRPIGVYFSPATRNSFPDEFIRSYRGMMCLLLQTHLEFQVVTPRTLAAFSGPLLILPDARCMSAGEIGALRAFARSGGSVLVTGETAGYDEDRRARARNPVHEWLGIAGSAPSRNAAPRFIYHRDCPGRAYYDALESEFNQYAGRPGYEGARFERLRRELADEIARLVPAAPVVEVSASPFVSTQIASVAGAPHVFIANFRGLKAKEVAEQAPERNLTVTFSAAARSKVYLLPFLGEIAALDCSSKAGKVVCVIPEIDKGAVVWLETGR